MADDEADWRVQREMGCTRAELMAALVRLGLPLHVGADSVTLEFDSGAIEIAMHARAPRALGALALPVLGVEMMFRGIAPHRREVFLQCFELYTRRGGG